MTDTAPTRTSAGRTLIARLKWPFIFGAAIVSLLVATVAIAHAVVGYTETPEQTWGVDGEAFDLEVIGDQIWVGGLFNNARAFPFNSPDQTRNNLAVFNVNDGTLLGTTYNTNGQVSAIESDGETVWIGGAFTTVNGTTRNRIAAMNLNTGNFVAGFNETVNGVVHDLHLHDGWLYVAGDFNGYNVSGKRNLIRINPQTGSIDPGFSPNPNATVFSIDAFGNELLAGGIFTRIGPDNAREDKAYVAAVNADTGVELNRGYDNLNVFGRIREGVDVVRFSNSGNSVYVGDRENFVTKYRRTTSVMRWQVRGQGNIQAFAEDNDTLYVGLHDGWLLDGDGQMLLGLNANNGAVQNFTVEMNSFWGVRALEATPQGLIAVGDFTNVVGVNARHIAYFRPLGGWNPAPPLNPPPPTPDPNIPPTPTPTATPTPTPTPGPTPTPTPTPSPTPTPTATPTPTPQPPLPQVISIETRTDNAALVEFETIADAQTYEIHQRGSGAAPWQLVRSVDAEADATSQITMVAPDDGWAPIDGQDYDLSIRAVKTNGSVTSYAQASPVTFGTPPRGLQQTAAFSSSATLSWTAAPSNEPFAAYEIYVGGPDDYLPDCQVTSISSRTQTTYNATSEGSGCGGESLQAGQDYVFGVRVAQRTQTPIVRSDMTVKRFTTAGRIIPPESFRTANIGGTWSIVDSGNNPVTWAGLNVRRGELSSYSYTQAELESMKAQGFDTLRIILEWSRFERDPGVMNSTSFNALEQTLDRAATAGLDVILDPLHLAEGPEWQIPDWAWERTTGGEYDEDQMLDVLRQNAIPYIQHVIARYGNRPEIVAIDIINEPREPDEGSLSNNNDELIKLYHDFIALARDLDADKPLILEPFYGSALMASSIIDDVANATDHDPNPVAGDYTNLIWSVHDYYAGGEGTATSDGYTNSGYSLRGSNIDGTRHRSENWTNTSCYPSGPSADNCTNTRSRVDVTLPSMVRHIELHYDAAQAAGMPLFVGEYGIPHEGQGNLGWGNGDLYIADKLAVYESMGVSHAIWAWRSDVDPTFGLYDRGSLQWHPWTDQVDPVERRANASWVCAGALSGEVEVLLQNMDAATATYIATIDGTPTTRVLSSNTYDSVTLTLDERGPTPVTVTRNGTQIYSRTLDVPCGPDPDDGGGDPPGEDTAEVMHVVSCLAGNGRVDTNIVNTGTDVATYRLEFEGLSARATPVQPGDWWRMPITGRPDDDFNVVVKRDGIVVSDRTVTVSCDGAIPVVDSDEVRVVNSCRAGNGYLLFQFVNARDTRKIYVIEFEGVRNRSANTAEWGQLVRAVTGRQDGTYDVLIRENSTPVATMQVTVDCDP